MSRPPFPAERDAGLSRLEVLGLAAAVFGLVIFIPQVRSALGGLYGDLIWDSTIASGILVGVGSFVIFCGAVFLLMYTNLGGRLAFLLSGAALFGFGTLSGLLFTVYSPRGPRPANIEGLNAFQIRIMPLAMTVGAAVLFAMFLAALSRYEAASGEND